MRHVPRVKICGIASREDAFTALGHGADALGFLVGLCYETPDRLSPDRARDLVSSLPPFVNSVLVTHLSDLSEVTEICRLVGPQAVQLHGDFPVADIAPLRESLRHLKILKTVHSEDDASLEQAKAAALQADAVLLDTRIGERIGGTGETHDWSLSQGIREALEGFPVILAGGLRPDNVASAIERVRPYGVDVNSGVKADAVRKSPELVQSFIATAKSTLAEDGAHATTRSRAPAQGRP